MSDELITLVEFSVFINIECCTLRAAKFNNLAAFPTPISDVKKGAALLYRKAELISWNNARPKKIFPRQLNNELAQQFLRTPPHCGVNLRG